MVMKFLRGLLGGGGEGASGSKHEAVVYQGYRIEPSPARQDSGWTTSGTISREMEGETKTYSFVRADTSMSEDAAVELIVRKAQRLIDEQGDRLFNKT